MQSALEQLYLGGIDFDAKFYGQNSDYLKAARRAKEGYDKLIASLNGEQKEWLEQYCDGEIDREGIMKYNIYLDALRFGIRLMAEVYAEGAER